jgi:hypothetical protein
MRQSNPYIQIQYPWPHFKNPSFSANGSSPLAQVSKVAEALVDKQEEAHQGASGGAPALAGNGQSTASLTSDTSTGGWGCLGGGARGQICW